MERFPEGTKVTLEDFKKSNLIQVLAENKYETYSSIWHAFSEAAGKATEEKRFSESKVLWLFADACSMMLKPESLNEPFAPIIVMRSGRSAIPEDFHTDDIKLLTEIISEIDHPKICARISDLLWLLVKPRNPKFALSAIDNYRQIPITSDSWIGDGRECWDRAIRLCLMLKKGSGDRLREIENVIIDSLNRSTSEDGYLVLELSELLAKYKLGQDDQSKISFKLEEFAIVFKENGDLNRSRDYYDAAAQWFTKIGDSEKSAEMIVRNSEEWISEAESRRTSETPSNIVAVRFYENAIQKLRTIPKALRENYEVDKRIALIRKEMNIAGENSLDELNEISIGSIDLSEIISHSIKAVEGKSSTEALFSFANIYHGAQYDKIYEFAEQMLKNHTPKFIFPLTHLSSDGRVIAKQPGADLSGEEKEEVLWPEMINHFMLEISYVVQGSIWPALEVLQQEHRLKEIDFYSLVNQSPIVPPDRTRLIAKALFLGYDNDFVGALHVLIPQIENLVRYHLKLIGVITTNLDINGIENENGLSTLLENIEVNKVFGDNLTFEFKSLLCDPIGPNLRNKLAHGLIGYEESQSAFSIYTWWLCLRIVLNTVWNSQHQNQDPLEIEEK